MPGNTPTTTPAVLKEANASTYLEMSRSYLRKGRCEGYGPPYIRIGKSIRYKVSDLDAWLELHRAGA